MTFNKSNRYTVPSDEDFEPGSDNEVLKNYLNIKSKEAMEGSEQNELIRTERTLSSLLKNERRFTDTPFTVEDICNIHTLWLGNIYPMAGKFRTVTLAKGGFLFAAPTLIEKLMNEFGQKILAKYTPCHFTDLNDIAYALGVVHVEFILIHPFREGNGRTARLIADLMAIQAKQVPLNYNKIDRTISEKGYEEYILAIHAGLGQDYEPIRKIFLTLLEQSQSL